MSTANADENWLWSPNVRSRPIADIDGSIRHSALGSSLIAVKAGTCSMLEYDQNGRSRANLSDFTWQLSFQSGPKWTHVTPRDPTGAYSRSGTVCGARIGTCAWR